MQGDVHIFQFFNLLLQSFGLSYVMLIKSSPMFQEVSFCALLWSLVIQFEFANTSYLLTWGFCFIMRWTFRCVRDIVHNLPSLLLSKLLDIDIVSSYMYSKQC